jgi:hypothetical protein
LVFSVLSHTLIVVVVVLSPQNYFSKSSSSSQLMQIAHLFDDETQVGSTNSAAKDDETHGFGVDVV